MDGYTDRNGNLANRKIWNQGVKHLSKNDKTLARAISKIKYPKFELQANHYHTLVESIVSQQIAWSAANAILKKFKALYGGKIPEPEQFLRTKEKKVRGAGISPQKYSYIKDLCERIESGRLNIRKLASMGDEEAIEILDEVRGIGRWTAEMFLIFSLGRTDVLPVDDLGFRKGVQKIYKLRELPDKKKLYHISKDWSPYRSIATLYLWRSAD
jgi:DNA-3-methyladenine glycosylase II